MAREQKMEVLKRPIYLIKAGADVELPEEQMHTQIEHLPSSTSSFDKCFGHGLDSKKEVLENEQKQEFN